MNFYICAFTFSVVVHLTQSILLSSICHLSNGRNSSQASLHEQQQQQHQTNECDHMYPHIHKCGKDKCLRNETDCDEYTSLDRHFNSRLFRTNIGMALLPTEARNKMRERQRKFKKFQNKIKLCTLVRSNTLQFKDVCLRRKKCYKQKENDLTTGEGEHKSNFKRIDCPCDGRHGYECNKDYCTPSKYTCDLFDELKQANGTGTDSVKKCSFINI